MPLVPVDVRVNTVESRVRVADEEALLTPEILEKITAAVMQRLDERTRIQASRDSDTRIDHPVRSGIRRL